MPRAANGDIEIEYETLGFDDDPPLVLIPGQGSPLLLFPEELCRGFVDRGFYVIRLENRDAGLSTIMPEASTYTIADMADDIAAVLDHAGIERAHIAGHSLGGMIAQRVAIHHRDRVITLTSMSSMTGNFEYAIPSEAALEVMGATLPTDREGYLQGQVRGRLAWASPEWGDDPVEIRKYFEEALDRAPYSSAGSDRHLAAALADGEREDLLRELDVPTVVIHGDKDTLIPLTAGERTAEIIPGAELVTIEGLGHDLPVQAWQPIITAVTTLASRNADQTI